MSNVGTLISYWYVVSKIYHESNVLEIKQLILKNLKIIKTFLEKALHTQFFRADYS